MASRKTMPAGRETITVNLPVELAAKLRVAAAGIDVSMTTFVEGLLRGAFAKGWAERHVMDAIASGKVVANQRSFRTNQLRWEQIEKGHVRHGEYQMTRLGAGGSHSKPGDGWYLEGPGITEPLYVGVTRLEAEDTANAIIRRNVQREAS